MGDDIDLSYFWYCFSLNLRSAAKLSFKRQDITEPWTDAITHWLPRLGATQK